MSIAKTASIPFNNAGAASFASGAGSPSASGANDILSPDAMIIYCQSRLRNLDSQINQKIEKQRQLTEPPASVAQLKQAIQKCQEAKINDKGCYEVSNADYEAVGQAFAAVANDPSLSKAEKEAIFATKAGFDCGDDHAVSSPELKGVTDACEKLQTNRNQDAEINMLSIQSLMSQRQTAVQLTTNILASINESTKSVVNNTKG